jgi:SAM-dependent methyltransferase
MHSLTEQIYMRLVRWLDSSEFCQRLISRLLIQSPVVEGKIYPFAEADEAWWAERGPVLSDGAAPDEYPVPPRELWERYGMEPREYLETGKQHTERMLKILSAAGFSMEKAERVMDFGCSAGRMVRWLIPYAKSREIWGVDVASKPVHWAMLNLSPPLHFAVNTTVPHLPFEGGTFDMIYCGSVFTHISDLADSWFLELRRVLKSGGYLYLTIHDRHTVDLLFGRDSKYRVAQALRRLDERIGMRKLNYAKFVFAKSPKNTQVYYELEWLRAHWGRWMELVSVTEEAYGFQTALVFRKR